MSFANPIKCGMFPFISDGIQASSIPIQHENLASIMEGYAKLAQLMASFNEFAILRHFKTLNYQNLLYLHAELIHLESELRDLAERDAQHANRQYHAKDWFSLSQAQDGEDREQWEKVIELREKLEKYSELPNESRAGLLSLLRRSYRRCSTQKFLYIKTRLTKR
jgi:hypothetical protein